MTTQLAALAAYLETIPYNDVEERYDVALDAGPEGNLLRVHDNKFFLTIYATKVDPSNVKESVITTVNEFIRKEDYWLGPNVYYQLLKVMAAFKS